MHTCILVILCMFCFLYSSVLWMDIKHTEENKRLTAIGCENGYVQLSIVDTLNELSE